jgi:uncharacterized protein (DUF697 family)
MRGAGDGSVPVVGVLTQSDLVAVGPDALSTETAPGATDREAIELARERLEMAMKVAGLEPRAVLATRLEGEPREASVARLTRSLFAELPEVARIETARAFRGADVQRREIANRIVRSTATIALTVGLAPVPLSDAFIIAPLQVLMVSAVAHIGGRPWDRKAALEWIASMGLVGGAGFGLRWTAQQLVKLVPGAGTLVSAGVAGAGTVTLGQSAIAYFLRDRKVREIPADAAA